MAAATVVSPRMSPQEPDAAVGGDHDRGFQVALGDDLEQGGGGFGGQRKVAQFVDGQERGSGVEAHGGGPAAFDGGAVAAGGEVGGGGEVGAVAGVRGGSGEADGEVGFPDTGWSDHDHVGGGFEVAAGAEFVDQLRVERRWRRRSRSPPRWRGWAGRRIGAGRRAGGLRWRRPRRPSSRSNAAVIESPSAAAWSRTVGQVFGGGVRAGGRRGGRGAAGSGSPRDAVDRAAGFVAGSRVS